MQPLNHRTKIVATIGPASSSPEMIKKMVHTGMSVARLNFSHGSYDDHAKMITLLRSVSQELGTPITLLQDLQGPKIRVGQLTEGELTLEEGGALDLVPMDNYHGESTTACIDYPFLAEDAEIGMQILLDDGLLELEVEDIKGNTVHCRVIAGGVLKSRKGVNLPSIDIRLPSLTEKDQQDLEFGISQGVDWVSLSFVRKPEDIQSLRNLLAEKGVPDVPVLAKIEKPQAIANLDAILEQCDGVMVARGDLGVEMKSEKVPMLQKQIIRECNKRSIPVITATQMLDSMIRNPRPTRAEASDVANAIIDGTDAVMLSGESAVGLYPIKAVEMLARIAADVEPEIQYINNPPAADDETHALSEALNTIDKILDLQAIVTFTSTGYTAMIAAGERPNAPVVAFTPSVKVYHRLNLVWGVKPILLDHDPTSFEEMVTRAQAELLKHNLAQPGHQVLIMGGIPAKTPQGTNFLKLHRLAEQT